MESILSRNTDVSDLLGIMYKKKNGIHRTKILQGTLEQRKESLFTLTKSCHEFIFPEPNGDVTISKLFNRQEL